VCHDAGGAEIVSSYIKSKDLKASYCVQGPAKDIFMKKLGLIDNKSLYDLVNDSNLIITGTSWGSDIEFNAIELAKKLNKKIVSYLDHWINYHERFIRNGKSIFPDEIWVGDMYALKIAKLNFPNQVIKLVKNEYLNAIKVDFDSIKNIGDVSKKVLFVSENISEHMNNLYGDDLYLGYNEISSIRVFLDNILEIKQNIESIVIRPHPSEINILQKYGWIFQHPINKKCKIEISTESSLLYDIAQSSIVVGCTSMALVVALICKKNVMTCIPQDIDSPLPHKEIVNLNNLIKTR